MRRCVLLAVILMLLITACGQEGTDEVSGTADSAPEQSKNALFDWRDEEWNADLKETSSYPLYLKQYTDGLEADESGLPYDYQKTFYCAAGNNFYTLDCLGMTLTDTGGMLMTYYLNCYEGENGDINKQNIPLPDIPDSAGLDKSVVAFDVVNEQECVLFVQIRQEESLHNYYAVHLSMKGEYLRMVDLYPAMAENNIPGMETWVYDNIHVDSQGNYYLIPDISQGEVLVLGTDGTLLHRLEAGEQGESVQFAMKDPDRNPVFKWYNSRENTILLAGYEASVGKKSYVRVQIPCGMSMVLSEEGFLYYTGLDGKLYRWDLRTGEYAFCMDYGDLGIGANSSMLYMVTGSNGEPVLLDCAGKNAHIYSLSKEQATAQTMIRLVSTTSYCDYISACAARFSREQDNCVILVEKPQTEGMDSEAYYRAQDEFRDQALLELTAGKAADLYLVSAADMEMLYEKGVLADLTGILPEELESCIFPGVLDGGVMDGRQIGLTPEATARVAMVSNELWQGDSWTLQEALDLMDAQPQLRYLLIHSGYNYGTGHLLQVFLQDIENSPFLNLEEGTCDFNNSLFIRLLEHVKGYGNAGSWEYDPLAEGSAAGFFTSVVSYPHFTYIMEEYGEQYHPVGFPTDGESGNYWVCDYFLVMNKDTSHRDILEKYLMELFDTENQRLCDRAVRSDMSSRFTIADAYDPNGGLLYDKGDGVYSRLGTKPDGSSWEQEYLELMNHCVSRSDRTDPIVDIIMEEADSYFTGSKDAEAAAQIIQNRVQLYLDEQYK